MIDEKTFAHRSLYAYMLYAALAERERSPVFRADLLSLAHTFREQFDFWARKSGVRGDLVEVPKTAIFFYRMFRLLFGITIMTKFIMGRKEHTVTEYLSYCRTCTVEDDGAVIDAFVERLHALTDSIEDARARFFSNVVLGFNDALIELTGALVAFSFTLSSPRFVFVVGLITGVSASMSMAASAFLQARHQHGGNPARSALYTGVSYLAIVCALIAPFLLCQSMVAARVVLAGVVVALLLLISFCSAVLLERSYLRQLGEMALLSLGVAFLAFLIGKAVNLFIHIPL